MSKPLAYPRALVHMNGDHVWALAWRTNGVNDWASAMTFDHYADLSDAHTEAARRVRLMWKKLNKGNQS